MKEFPNETSRNGRRQQHDGLRLLLRGPENVCAEAVMSVGVRAAGAHDGLQTVGGRFTLLETVGQGTFGEVMLAVERHTRESVAVKILEKEKIIDEDSRQRLVNEIQILHRVQHNNLVQLLEVIEEADRIYLVTEYVGGGELFSYIVQKGRLDEAEASRLFAQMAAAVDSCHRQLVIHRDLKPENVLLDAHGDIKVIDFGLGTVLKYADEVLTVACGSPHYAAPEMLIGGGYLGQRADMWSLGVCLYAMVCGCLPFDAPPEEMDLLYDKIISGEYDFTPAPHLTAGCRDLICGMLKYPPEDRLTGRQVLGHKWLRATAPSLTSNHLLSTGLVGAVVDPSCRQLARKMELEYGMPQKDIIEALRKGERSPLTSTYWLLRQRELRKGNIKHFAAHLPRPPPPRIPSQRRRPVPAHIQAAAAKLPAVHAPPTTAFRGLPAIAYGEGGGPLGGTPTGPTPTTARTGSRYDEVSKPGGSAAAPFVQRARVEEPIFVHPSGALSSRNDRDGNTRRLHEMEQGPVRRAVGARTGVSGGHPGHSSAIPSVRESQITQISVTGTARGSPGAVRGASSAYRDSPSGKQRR